MYIHHTYTIYTPNTPLNTLYTPYIHHCMVGMVRRRIDCTAMGLKKCEILDLKGGDCKRNAEILRDVFAGGQMDSAITETIALNAGAGLYVYGTADR